jgi:LysM repeat protein
MSILLISCTQTKAIGLTLNPYSTRVVDQTNKLTTVQPAITNTPLPTNTPQIYTIAYNDTIYGIAKRFDLTPETLLFANPSTVPSALTIGDTLIIPEQSISSGNSAQFTPVPLTLSASTCYPQPDGLECFVSVKNENETSLENIVVRFTLFDKTGEQMQSKNGLLLLNVLPPGKTYPAHVFFSGITKFGDHSAELVASNKLSLTQEPTVGARIVDQQINSSWNGLSSSVSGKIESSSPSAQEITLWVAAVGYDADGNTIGYRRWEGTGLLEQGKSIPFQLDLFSFAGAISRIEVFLEEIKQR